MLFIFTLLLDLIEFGCMEKKSTLKTDLLY